MPKVAVVAPSYDLFEAVILSTIVTPKTMFPALLGDLTGIHTFFSNGSIFFFLLFLPFLLIFLFLSIVYFIR